MKNLLIVESINDNFFVEALIRHLNLQNIEILDSFVCGIDDFECMDGLNEIKLKEAIESARNKAKKTGAERVGILIDHDDKTIAERLSLVNTCIQQVFAVPALLAKVSELKEVAIDDKQNLEIAAFFTNVDGSGELETVLKEIKANDSTYADCLDSWQTCLKSKGISGGSGLKKKDFDKFWISIYTRYDTCTSKEAKQAARKCTLEAALSKAIWDFEHPCLDEIKMFLRLFVQ